MEDINQIMVDINKINNNIYFSMLSEWPPLSRFMDSQESFIDAVDNWSKMLGLMLNAVPTYKERSVIINNLYDEHGSGDIKHSHVNTFSKLLVSIGYNKEIKLYDEKLPGYSLVNNFNEGIRNSIETKSWIYVISLLAMIEYTYIDVSKNIHSYLNMYMDHDNINHYTIHEVMDTKHFTDLIHLVLPYFNNDDSNISYRKDIIDGLHNGYLLMDELYTDLSIFL